MNTFYSFETKGFYPESLKPVYEAAGTWPSDAYRLSHAEHAALLSDLEAGKVIQEKSGKPVAVDPPVQPASVPRAVSRFQARRALKDAGVFAQVEAAIAQADEFTQDAWADAQEFRRESDLILILGESLQLNLDALFIAAAKIEA